MNINELFSGVAVVIDNNIHNAESGDQIIQIVKKLEEYHIPLLKYENIPDIEIIKQFNNINFILLDWDLNEPVITEEVAPVSGTLELTIPKTSEDLNVRANIEFIEDLKKITFAPIFIFSKEAPETIIGALGDLYVRDSSNHIFVKKKDDLISEKDENKIFTEIEEWLKTIPSIYVLKEWEAALHKAKKDLFWDFYNINHKWPAVLHKTFKDDGSDVNYELGNFIFKQIMARTEPIKFCEDILKIEDDDISKDDIRKILEAERFIQDDSLPDIPFTGDLYQYQVPGEEEKRYFLNIRPECDIAIQKGKTANPELYCLKGKLINEYLINSGSEDEIKFNKGVFIEKTNNIFLPFVVNDRILGFSFQDIKIKKWNSLKKDRVGKILPPYITRIQQKYSFYLQRQGLPAIPVKAIEKGETHHDPAS